MFISTVLPKDTAKAFQANNLLKYLWCILTRFSSTRLYVASSACVAYVPFSERQYIYLYFTFPCILSTVSFSTHITLYIFQCQNSIKIIMASFLCVVKGPAADATDAPQP
jgi:hypothetical protein